MTTVLLSSLCTRLLFVTASSGRCCRASRGMYSTVLPSSLNLLSVEKTNNSWTSVIRSVKVIHTSNTKYSISSHPSCHSSFLLLQTANPSHIIVLCMLVKWINTRAWKGNTIKVYCYAFMPVWHVSAVTNGFYDCCSFSLWLLQYLLLLPSWISNRCLLQLL